jgi:putative redox protein
MALVEVVFAGGKKIDARIAGHSIPTDQSVQNGGENNAPEPFQLFLASIVTCAGLYAKSFCEERDLLAPRGLEMDIARKDEDHLSRLDLVLHVHASFPAKYERAIARAMGLCSVKKQLCKDIEMSIRVVRSSS